MTDSLITASDPGDDWLDAALRQDGARHRGNYVDDDGFTARVMAKLPAPAALPAWRKPVLVLLWAGAAIGVAVALPAAATDVAREVIRVVVQPVSAAQLVAGVLMLGGAMWAAAAFALKND